MAPNISSDPLAGIGDRPLGDIVRFLRTGADKSLGMAFGPMGEVVHDSLRYLNDGDVTAIAVFLKEGPDRKETGPTADATRATLKRGQMLYLQIARNATRTTAGASPARSPISPAMRS